MKTKLVCKEHGERVGGCDCVGAVVKTVPCPGMSAHIATPKPFTLNVIVEQANIESEEHRLAMEAYEARKEQI